jgi:hypothetical protein
MKSLVSLVWELSMTRRWLARQRHLLDTTKLIIVRHNLQSSCSRHHESWSDSWNQSPKYSNNWGFTFVVNLNNLVRHWWSLLPKERMINCLLVRFFLVDFYFFNSWSCYYHNNMASRSNFLGFVWEFGGEGSWGEK